MSVEIDQSKIRRNPDLDNLIRLQKIDSEIALNEELLKSLPDQISKCYSECETAQNNLKDFDEKQEEDKKLSIELEKEVEDINVKITNDEAKLPSIKTNVEYRAIIKEQGNYKKKIITLEEKQLELMESLETRGSERVALEKVSHAEEEKFQIVKSEKEAAIIKVKAALDKLNERRESIITNIDPSTLGAYENVSGARDGVGVSIVRDQLCKGCNQIIPPQLYYIIKSSEGIHRCPHCNRFLYFEDEATAVEEK